MGAKQPRIFIGEPQPVACPKCSNFCGYQYHDTFLMDYVSCHLANGTYEMGFYTDGKNTKKGIDAYCINCLTKLKFKLVRKVREELEPVGEYLQNSKSIDSIELSIDDVTVWNVVGLCNDTGGWHSFTIEKLTDKIVTDDMLGEIITHFEDAGIETDIFNIEYLGCLTGEIKTSKETLIDELIKFFKNN